MTEDYNDLKSAVENAGFFTTFQPIERPSDRLVCASHQYEQGQFRHGLHGNSFWVAKRGEVWFLASWSPVIYRVERAERLSELCLQLLGRQRARAYGDFDEEVQREFGLVEVSDEEFSSTE